MSQGLGKFTVVLDVTEETMDGEEISVSRYHPVSAPWVHVEQQRAANGTDDAGHQGIGILAALICTSIVVAALTLAMVFIW